MHYKRINHKEFAAAIFYPYEIMTTSYKYHISQMNFTFKACLYYCSNFDLNGPGSLIEKGLNTKNLAEIKKDDILLRNLEIAFPFNDSSFIKRAKEYLVKEGNSERLSENSMRTGSAVQSLNLGRLLNAIGKTTLGDQLLSKAFSQGAMQIEEESFLSLLDVAFVANNGAFVEKAKVYLGETDNFDRLYARVMRTGSATQLLSFGIILKNIGRHDIAVECFRNAASKNSQKAILELAYYDIEAGKDVVEKLSPIGPYGFWKIAQCFRYGKKVEKNLSRANDFYRQALQGANEFPEIAYDTGDFIEELALAQTDEDLFLETIIRAIELFKKSGRGNLGSGYIRAAQLMVEANNRYPDSENKFSDQTIFDLAYAAAQKGSYTKAKTFLERIGSSADLLSSATIEIDKFIKDINRKFG